MRKKVTPDSDSRSRKIGIGSGFGSGFGSRFGSDFFKIGSEKKVTPDSDSRSRKIGIGSGFGSRFGSRFGSDFFKIGSGFLSLQEPFQEPIQGHFGGILGAISGASLGSFCGLENGRFSVLKIKHSFIYHYYSKQHSFPDKTNQKQKHWKYILYDHGIQSFSW